jgi:hypothetical protein
LLSDITSDSPFNRRIFVQVFSIKNGEAALAFKTLPGTPINRLELGGAIGTLR